MFTLDHIKLTLLWQGLRRSRGGPGLGSCSGTHPHPATGSRRCARQNRRSEKGNKSLFYRHRLPLQTPASLSAPSAPRRGGPARTCDAVVLWGGAGHAPRPVGRELHRVAVQPGQPQGTGTAARRAHGRSPGPGPGPGAEMPPPPRRAHGPAGSAPPGGRCWSCGPAAIFGDGRGRHGALSAWRAAPAGPAGEGVAAAAKGPWAPGEVLLALRGYPARPRCARRPPVAAGFCSDRLCLRPLWRRRVLWPLHSKAVSLGGACWELYYSLLSGFYT